MGNDKSYITNSGNKCSSLIYGGPVGAVPGPLPSVITVRSTGSTSSGMEGLVLVALGAVVGSLGSRAVVIGPGGQGSPAP